MKGSSSSKLSQLSDGAECVESPRWIFYEASVWASEARLVFSNLVFLFVSGVFCLSGFKFGLLNECDEQSSFCDCLFTKRDSMHIWGVWLG